MQCCEIYSRIVWRWEERRGIYVKINGLAVLSYSCLLDLPLLNREPDGAVGEEVICQSCLLRPTPLPDGPAAGWHIWSRSPRPRRSSPSRAATASWAGIWTIMGRRRRGGDGRPGGDGVVGSFWPHYPNFPILRKNGGVQRAVFWHVFMHPFPTLRKKFYPM